MLTILGGTYREVCLAPDWDRLFGSGWRAAQALAEVVDDPIHFFTFASKSDRNELRDYAANQNITVTTRPRDESIEFQYDHSAATPRLFASDSDIGRKEPIILDSMDGGARDSVLVYSFIEEKGQSAFEARRAVYDPQAGSRAKPFPASICKVGKLAIVLNLIEAKAVATVHGLQRASTMSPSQLAQALLKHEGADVVIIKNGLFGAHVAAGYHATQNVAAFKTDRYFGIGSGDIFSAVFGAMWMEFELHPFEAAEIASGATAYYCNQQGLLPLPPDVFELGDRFEPIDLDRIKAGGEPKLTGVKPIYLAGPFFSLSQKWLINQAFDALQSAGLKVWSPSIEAGILTADASPEEVENVVQADLDGLTTCGSVFAIADQMDPGTVFEVGYAIRMGLPITVYSENTNSSDLTMFVGSGCFVTDDFASALAHAMAIAYKL